MMGADSVWLVGPGLAGAGTYSLRPTNFPDRFLRHRDFQLWVDAQEESDLFKQDASFKIVSGLADAAGISFESVNFPGHFIRHRGFELFNDCNDHSDLFKLDATFILEPIAKEVEMGPLWSNDDATEKAKAWEAGNPGWRFTGHWNTTIPGEMSVIHVEKIQK